MLLIEILLPVRMHSAAMRIAEELRNHSRVKVCSHIDADGIAAAGIASSALEGIGIENSVVFVKNLDEDVIRKLRDENEELVWFTDLGSGSLELIQGLNCVISDHHVPSEDPCVSKKGQALEVNPHHFGKDGALDISGAGVTYLVATALERTNVDLAYLAVLGAVGDMQDQSYLRLTGTNRVIMEEGRNAGVLDWEMDARFFGRETRSLPRLLQYSNDPLLPGLTGNWKACNDFLLGMGIPLRRPGGYRRWIDLSSHERARIVSELVKLIVGSGLGSALASRLVGEVYLFPNEREGTELHEAKEFATLLNACGRYEKARIGFALCKGDRGEAFDSAVMLLKGHRAALVDSLRIAFEVGVSRMEHIQFFHGGGRILDSVIGITAGMLLSSGEIDSGMPLFAFAYAEDGVKVSARGTREMVAKGLDLSIVIKEACEVVGGVGGGHNIAAGATIPFGSEEEFLEIADSLVGGQIQKGSE